MESPETRARFESFRRHSWGISSFFLFRIPVPAMVLPRLFWLDTEAKLWLHARLPVFLLPQRRSDKGFEWPSHQAPNVLDSDRGGR